MSATANTPRGPIHAARAELALCEKRVARSLIKARIALLKGDERLAVFCEKQAREHLRTYRRIEARLQLLYAVPA